MIQKHEESIDVIDPKEIARDQLNQKEIMAIIQKAIHKLPEEQKEALILTGIPRF